MGTHVAYLTKDLLFSSRVMSLARQAGVDMKVVGSRRALLDEAIGNPVAVAMIDLEHPEAEMVGLVHELRTCEPAPKVIAYGPHVKQALLDGALAAGADMVLSRGQFDKQVGAILQTAALTNQSESAKESS